MRPGNDSYVAFCGESIGESYDTSNNLNMISNSNIVSNSISNSNMVSNSISNSNLISNSVSNLSNSNTYSDLSIDVEPASSNISVVNSISNSNLNMSSKLKHISVEASDLSKLDLTHATYFPLEELFYIDPIVTVKMGERGPEWQAAFEV